MRITGDVEIVVRAGADLGEGVAWDTVAQRVLWLDIMRGLVHVFDPVAELSRTIDVGQPVGALVPRAAGGLAVAVRDGFAGLDPESGRLSIIARVESDIPFTRMNDGACDAAGRFWAGTMALDERPGAGALYRLDVDGSVHVMLTGTTISNGIDWTPDASRMLYIDSGAQRVDMFDFGLARGTIANRRTFVEIDPGAGTPDGMTIDAEGGVWVALWAGGALHRYLPDGTLDLIVRLPVTHPTSCAFGGADLRDLYITSASGQLTNEEKARQTAAGALLRCRPGVRGRPAQPYRG